MSEEEKTWEKKTKAMLKPLEESLGKMSSDLNDLRQRQTNPPSPNRGEPDMPIYKCKGKDCGFATDDLSDFIAHTVKENLPKPEEAKPEAPPKKRHETVEDYMNCPECFPKFEKAFLDRGYKKPEPNPKKEEKKATLF